MWLRIAILALFAGLLLSGCFGRPFTGPPGAQCSSFLRDAEGGVVSGLVERIAAQRARGLGPETPVDVNLLILSGGGKYGAYGAGFLNGWTERELSGGAVGMRRQDIDIVTGISTGSLLASYAAAGNAVAPADPARRTADSDMRDAYKVSDRDLFREHGLIKSIRSNAIADISNGLQVRVDELARTYIPKMRALPEGRAALVGLVNLDNGRFYVADLVEIARSNAPNAQLCYREMLLASSAVPLQFAPRYIEGSPYVDGGIRFGTFLGRDFAALNLRAPVGGAPPQPVRINFRAIINGTLSANDPVDDAAQAAACDAASLGEVATACPRAGNRLVDIAKRSASNILADQIYRDSAYRLYRELEALEVLGTGQYAYVSNREIADKGCKRATRDTFDRAFMDCLAEIGLAEGRAQQWQSFEQLPKASRFGAPPAGPDVVRPQ